jgi:hypothetical protein
MKAEAAAPFVPPYATLSLDFRVSDLQNNSYHLWVVGNAYSNQTGYYEAATCDVVTDQCSRLFSGLANPGGYPNINQTFISSGHLTYKVWSFQLDLDMAFNTFLPWAYPFDTYATPSIYISTNSTLVILPLLTSVTPPGFILTYEELRQIDQANLPKDFQLLPGFKGLQNWVSFVIGMIRSPIDFVVDSLYALPPVLSMYYVAILSYSLKDRKDRLAIYVGVLFSAFAFLLTLRQFLPPYPTLFEASVLLGILVWIFKEMSMKPALNDVESR